MKKGRRISFLWIILVLFLLTAGAAAGAYGYFSGKAPKISEEKDSALQKADRIPEKQENAIEHDQPDSERFSRKTEPIQENTVKGIVALDPGHQGSWVDMSESEPNAPGSDVMKTKATTGTQGRFTGISEYELNLDIALLLEEELKSRSYQVVMTRRDNDTAISNSERAVLANESGADFLIRIHANGSDDPASSGALAMAPGTDNPYVGHLSEQSTELAWDVLNAYCGSTEMGNLGVLSENTMTGINWSQIPVIILEMGFMTNESDDTRMADAAFRERMVNGIADGVDIYYAKYPSSVVGNGDEESPELRALLDTVENRYLNGRIGTGEKWAVKIQDLINGKSAEVNGDLQVRAASVIKLFIMAAVYDRMYGSVSAASSVYFSENYEGESDELIASMITVSDNDAANTLVERLGNGSFENGMAVVNAYCTENGYLQTSLGRRFLGSNANGDNYTSANDCTALVKAIFNGTCVNEEASSKMLEHMKNQTRRNKIPAGIVDSSVMTANKTGELSSAELGFVENDICVVWGAGKEYILCVFSDELSGRNSTAIETISGISGMVYEDLEY